MPDENVPLTAEEEELAQQVANMTVDAWSRTLITCTRRIRELEKQMLATQGEIVALKRLVTNGRGAFDA
jgi:hypothetical protein